MPARPGASPQPLSGTPAPRRAASDGGPTPSTRADPGQPLGEVPGPTARLDQLRFDPSVPHPARMYGYWLGGKDHFEADRRAAQEVMRLRPQVVVGARANRHFLARVVRFLAVSRGVRQFLDIGTGLPAADSTHQVAQQVDPACRVCYVDNDPLVLTHARALLTSVSPGVCGYIDGDVRDTATILAEAKRTLDLSQPVAVLLLAVLHFLPFSDRFKINICSDLLFCVVNMFAT